MLGGNASALCRHDGKERTIRVVGGSGFVVLHKDNDEVEELKINVGDEVVFERGVAYRITANRPALQLFSVQASKYVKRLHILEPPVVAKVVSLADMENSLRPEESGIKPRRNRSRAIEQQRSLNSARGRTTMAPTQSGSPSKGDSGINPQPGGARQFDDQGAG